MTTSTVHIIGAGPAGLTAALELTERGMRPHVLEMSAHVGGISRTESYKGYLFDIGGHRFYTKLPEIQALWERVLGAQFRRVPRLSRIYYDGQFYKYPLDFFSTLGNLGLRRSAEIVLSYAAAQVRPYPREDTFEEWVSNRFGKRLYEMFFRTYTEKVWGIPCNQIQAEWAAQRIQGLSLISAVKNALFPGRTHDVKTLIDEFDYPDRGPGMMWQAFERAVIANGGQVTLQAGVRRVIHDGSRATHIVYATPQGEITAPVEHIISSMPLRELIHALDPAVPDDVRAAADDLKYRDFLLVGLILNTRESFKDNWIYIHTPDVRVGRIQNYKNWSPAMLPDETKTSLGMEYFCNEGDDLWQTDDHALIQLAAHELEQLNLGRASSVIDGVVIRQKKAYPVYDQSYRDNLAVIRRFLQTLPNLQTIGRNGLHRYNNQDHSMLTGLLAARNAAGESHDVWDVNTERSYYETFMTER